MSLVQRLLDAALRNENDYGEAETGTLLREAAWSIQAYELQDEPRKEATPEAVAADVNRVAKEYAELVTNIARDWHLTRLQAGSLIARVSYFFEPRKASSAKPEGTTT